MVHVVSIFVGFPMLIIAQIMCTSLSLLIFLSVFIIYLSFLSRLIEDEKEIITNATALKLLLTKTGLAIPSLPPGISCNKVVIVDLNTVSNDWQDDQTWTKARAPGKKNIPGLAKF